MNVRNIMREIELRTKGSEVVERAVIKTYNPERKFGFVRIGEKRDVYFTLRIVEASGLRESDIVLGAKVSVVVWHIHSPGPEVKKFVPGTVALPPPAPTAIAALPPPPSTAVSELVDEWGLRNQSRNRYPGGIEQLVIDHLKTKPVTTREELRKDLISYEYNANSLNTALSKVHAAGWFIENGGKLHLRPGKPVMRGKR